MIYAKKSLAKMHFYSQKHIFAKAIEYLPKVGCLRVVHPERCSVRRC